MDQYQVNVAVRLLALEEVLVHVAKVLFVAIGATEQGMADLRERASQKLQESHLPGFEPALSDHLSAELQVAVDEMLSRIETGAAILRMQLHDAHPKD
ncbi:MAG: hypothetical protein CTY28_10235 [Hyphomicrobium sp.]|nr:MAG: hypothetical protein CTY28_10235 [Hyphomicrobium sp.]